MEQDRQISTEHYIDFALEAPQALALRANQRGLACHVVEHSQRSDQTQYI